MINIAQPSLGIDEKEAVCKVIDSGMIASGSIVNEFEINFSNYIGKKYGIATSSGTTALEIALRAMGIGIGDKVITTAYSFIASTNAIIYTGALPVFVDIDQSDYNISPELIENMILKDPKIKALLIVHLFGLPCNMEKIMQITNKYNIKLIEDCAQAHGATWNNKKVGSFGTVSAFSFYPTKNMTTGEGGIVLTDIPEIEKKARVLINHGMEIRYHHDCIGYNYRMTNIAAAIGICQLKKLDSFNQKRRINAEYYYQNIKNDTFILPTNDKGHVYHQFTLRVKHNKREHFIQYLEQNQIGYGIFYPLSIPEQKCYDNYEFEKNYENTDCIKNEVISIPVHPLLKEDDLKFIVGKINDFCGEI